MDEIKMETMLRAIFNALPDYAQSDWDFIAEPNAGIQDVHTFEESGVMTRNRGVVVRLTDGSEFQLTVVQSRSAR